MKKIILLMAMHFVLASAFAQSEKFDIATFTAPKDFKKDSKPGLLNFSNVNTTTGSFCVITIYASVPSAGDAKKNFDKEWKELVATPYKVALSPQTETQTTAEGWKLVTAAMPVKVDGNDIYVVLTVISGFGKSISIRTFLNDTSYTAQIDSLFASMQLDKTTSPTTSNNNSTVVPTNTSSGKFGSMVYTAPAGWSQQVFQDGVVFKPLDLPKEEHLAMQIMQPLNFAGSLEQALAKSYDEAAAMYKSTKMHEAGGGEYQKTAPKKSFNGWEYIQGNGGVQVENGTPYKTELGLDLFVIKINNRFERVAILKSRKNCNVSRYYPTDRVSYQNAINQFLFSLQFSDGPEPVLKPGTIIGNGIIGVWQGISLQATATSGVRYNVFSPIFLSNGQAYFGPKFPLGGLDGLDTRIPAELHRRDWGTYTFSNGRGVLRMPYGDIPLRMEGNKLIITPNKTDHRFYQLPSVDGARFSGTYVMSEAYGKIPSITFTADGKFVDNGAVRVLYHEYVDCVNEALAPGSGTYEVKNFTIHFNYSDGRKIKIAFLGTGYDKNNPSPAVLEMSYDYTPMKRQ